MIFETTRILIFEKSQKSGSKYKYLVVHPIQSERCVSCVKKTKKLLKTKQL